MLTRAPSVLPFGRETVHKKRLSPLSHSVHFVPCGLWSPVAELKGSKLKAESDFKAFAVCFDKGLEGNFSGYNKHRFATFGPTRDDSSRCDPKGDKSILQG